MAKASKAQIKANRQNAQRSTGPSSIEGKIKVSQNAITHGIFATSPLLPHESTERFEALKKDIIRIFPPVDAIATELVERIILSVLRQQRLRIAETAKLQISMTPESIAAEVNEALKLPFIKHLTAENISDNQEEVYHYWCKVHEELDVLNIQAAPNNLKEVSEELPNVFYQLEQKARKSTLKYDLFMKNPDEIIKALEDLKKYAQNYIETNAINHRGYEVAQQVKIAKSIPDSAILALLSKYQVQLDTDFHRAVDAYKDHIAWRSMRFEKNLEDFVNEAIAA